MAKVTHPQESRQLRRGSLLQHVDHGGGAHHQGTYVEPLSPLSRTTLRKYRKSTMAMKSPMEMKPLMGKSSINGGIFRCNIGLREGNRFLKHV